MKRIKAFISRILAIPMIVSMLPTNALTIDDEENIFDNKTTKATYIGTTGLADTTILPPLKIPPHAVNGEVAYCMQGEKNSPINTPMSLSGNYDYDSFIRGVLFYGYPYNETNLMEKHGVTETQARGMTQFAIWYYFNPSYFAPKSHPYLNELRSLAASVSAPAAVMSADTSSASVNINGSLQEAVNIRTSSDYSGTFTFPSDANIYTVDVNGNKRNTFGIGETFKVVAVSSVKGTITKTLNVAITEPTMLRFVPIGDSSIQELGMPTVKTTYSTMQLSIDFPGITATNGDIVVNKISDTGEKLSGVEFGLYSDSSANTLISKKTTDSEGKVTFDNLTIGTTYYVKELNSIDGYIMDNSIKKVDLVNVTENITVTNTKIMGRIKIIKNETGIKSKKLKGAEFNIIDSAKRVVDTITTDDSGEAISKKLPYGDYKIVENIAPIGYVLNSVEIPVKITENNKIYDVECENDIIKGRIEILKLDADGNKPLQGVKFGIYNSNNDSLIEELTTGSDGRITSSSLNYGNYYVKEIQPLNGYVNDNKKYPVDIAENNKVYVVDVFNSKVTGNLSIIKIDAETGDPLANVEFQIECIEGFDKGNTWSIVTDNNGIGKIDGLKYGNYEITEIRTLTGYILNTTPVPFTIDKNGQKIEKTISNQKIKGSFEILKYDAETGEPLANVEFKIDCTDGIDRGSTWKVITNNKGMGSINSLNYGNYQISEIKSLDGYILDTTPVPFTIDKDGQKIEKTISNKKIKGSFEILKYDAETGEPLANVEFKIDCLDGFDKGNSWKVITDSKGIGKIDELKYGSYQISEIKTLEGYVLDKTPVPFTIDSDGQKIEKTISNKKIKGNLEILKYDPETGKPLANVEFKIDCTDGFDKGNSWVVKTDNSGIGKMDELKYGKYKITEIRTLEGYVLDTTPVPFTIDSDGQKISKTVSNEKIKGNFELLKYDPDTKEPLANVEFEIECIEGFDKGNKTTFVTGDDGIYRGEKINYGKYKVVEIKTLEGYVLDTEPIYFDITENGQDIEINKANRKIYGQLEFSKTDLTTGEVIEGAHIKITGLDELNKDIVIEFVSSAEGNKFTLPYGKYEIIETIEPEGYIKTEEVGYFEILEDGEIVHAEIKNKRILGSLKINKLSKELNVPLSGAEFGVYNKNDELVARVTTDKDGCAEILDLPYGEYYYVEIKAPDGYLIDLNKYDFSITYDGEVVEETVYNSLLNPYPDGGEENLLNGPLPDTSGFGFVSIIVSALTLAGLYFIYKSKKLNI